MINEKQKIIVLRSIIFALILFLGFGFFYVSDYYRADKDSIKAFTQPNEVSSDLLDNNTMVFKSESVTKVLIFL